MTTLAEAIAQLEGVNPAYNNPGAISGTGDTGASFGSGIGIYSTLDAGKAALDNQLAAIYNGSSKYYSPSQTLAEFDSIYSGGARDGSQLASLMGVTPSTTLSQLQQQQQSVWSKITSPILDKIYGQGNAITAARSVTDSLTNHSRGLEDYTVIVVGLLLIAAGLFAFKQTQTIIETGTRVAKRGAEILAS